MPVETSSDSDSAPRKRTTSKRNTTADGGIKKATKPSGTKPTKPKAQSATSAKKQTPSSSKPRAKAAPSPAPTDDSPGDFLMSDLVTPSRFTASVALGTPFSIDRDSSGGSSSLEATHLERGRSAMDLAQDPHAVALLNLRHRLLEKLLTDEPPRWDRVFDSAMKAGPHQQAQLESLLKCCHSYDLAEFARISALDHQFQFYAQEHGLILARTPEGFSSGSGSSIAPSGDGPSALGSRSVRLVGGEEEGLEEFVSSKATRKGKEKAVVVSDSK
ncbi:hypothetical protein R3P38DRAFT_2837191 [Favolaschia claudopus]|uniref:Uncharacterized protein n=1 Tax=Favolaschia claudopus TaxID=2862362 RepID=A0AAW0E5Q7_9AGAR